MTESLLIRTLLFSSCHSGRGRRGQYLLVGERADAARLVLEAGLAALLHVAHVPQVPHQHPAACSAHDQPVSRHRQRVHLSRKTQRANTHLHACERHSAPKQSPRIIKPLKKATDRVTNTGTNILNTSVTQTK